MGAMKRMRQRFEEAEKQDHLKRKADAAQSRQRYRPAPGCPPLKSCRWIMGFFTLAAWACFIGLSLINNAGFWVGYVIFPYLVLAIVLLFLTRGWIHLLFVGSGELPVKEYRGSIGQCLGCLKAAAWLWTAAAAAEGVFLAITHSVQPLRELSFLLGCAGAAALTWGFQYAYARRIVYALCDPDDPVL